MSLDSGSRGVRITSGLVGLAVLHRHLALCNAALVRQSSKASNGQHGGCGAGHHQLCIAEGTGHLQKSMKC